MRKIVKEIKTSNNQKERSIMKKFAVCLSAFLLTFFLLSNAAYSHDDDYPKKRLTITSAQVDLEDEVIYINGKNFGNDPYVMLDEYELDIVDVPTNTLIQALLPDDLESGTYRLLVAKRNRKGKLIASKTDTMDLTISFYTETDPIFTDSPASGIVEGDITNWNDAYDWGDHDLAGYLTSYTETDPTVNLAKLKSLVSNNFHNLGGEDADTHLTETQVDDYVANNGYLTYYTETDPIFSVWDKSTGIRITQSQITDLDHFTSADETDPQVGSNTPNYVPKWNGNKLVTGTIYDDGNVGIGTTSPSENLVVGADFGDDYSGERIVIGGTSGLTGLVIGEDSDNRGWMLWSVEDDIMVFGTKVGGGAPYNTISLKRGNVGIGVRPDSRLKIKGSGNTIATSGLNVINSDNISSLFVRDDGNVGIGTTSPDSELEVNGTVAANAFTSTRPLIFKAPAETERMRIDDITGNVGIGTMSPSNPLEMASGAYVTAGGVWTDASSMEYKENIRDLTTEEAVVALKDLKPTKFTYKADDSDECLGFIAEDVPELVATKDRKGLSPMDIVAVLTKVVQQQQKEIEDLKARLNERR